MPQFMVLIFTYKIDGRLLVAPFFSFQQDFLSDLQYFAL